MSEFSDKDKKLWEWATRGTHALKSVPLSQTKPIPSREDLQKEMEFFLSSPCSLKSPSKTLSHVQKSLNFPLHLHSHIPPLADLTFFKQRYHIDLHGLTQDIAYSYLKKTLKQLYHEDIRELLIITGKGKSISCEKTLKTHYQGTLKLNVPRWLESMPLKKWVEKIKPASLDEGGDGALRIIIKKRQVISNDDASYS
jgi:hypothetical protein